MNLNKLSFLELWFVIEWEGEDGDYSSIPQHQILQAEEPSEGDKVQVKERSTKKVYNGTVLKKGKHNKQLAI